MAPWTEEDLFAACISNPIYTRQPLAILEEVWTAIVSLIASQSDLGKGVNLAPLGRSSFRVENLSHINSTDRRLIPVFSFSQSWLDMYRLNTRTTRLKPDGSIPVLDLNLNLIAHLTRTNKDIVSGVFRECLAQVGLAAQSGRAVRINIGAGMLASNLNRTIDFRAFDGEMVRGDADRLHHAGVGDVLERWKSGDVSVRSVTPRAMTPSRPQTSQSGARPQTSASTRDALGGQKIAIQARPPPAAATPTPLPAELASGFRPRTSSRAPVEGWRPSTSHSHSSSARGGGGDVEASALFNRKDLSETARQKLMETRVLQRVVSEGAYQRYEAKLAGARGYGDDGTMAILSNDAEKQRARMARTVALKEYLAAQIEDNSTRRMHSKLESYSSAALPPLASGGSGGALPSGIVDQAQLDARRKEAHAILEAQMRRREEERQREREAEKREGERIYNEAQQYLLTEKRKEWEKRVAVGTDLRNSWDRQRTLKEVEKNMSSPLKKPDYAGPSALLI